jgi:hypothetical protein
MKYAGYRAVDAGFSADACRSLRRLRMINYQHSVPDPDTDFAPMWVIRRVPQALSLDA